MKVLRHGDTIKKVECPECHCVFIYSTQNDIRYIVTTNDDGKLMTEKYVECPECACRVEVE